MKVSPSGILDDINPNAIIIPRILSFSLSLGNPLYLVFFFFSFFFLSDGFEIVVESHFCESAPSDRVIKVEDFQAVKERKKKKWRTR